MGAPGTSWRLRLDGPPDRSGISSVPQKTEEPGLLARPFRNMRTGETIPFPLSPASHQFGGHAREGKSWGSPTRKTILDELGG
jgi:hypothetical protein